MTVKTFLEQQIEKAKNSVTYCEKDLAERRQNLFMLE
jgi:hypothetical protein